MHLVLPRLRSAPFGFWFGTFAHGARGPGSGQQFLGDLFGLFRFKVQRQLNAAICRYIDANHAKAGRADLQVRRNLALLVDAHSGLRSEHVRASATGMDVQAEFDAPKPGQDAIAWGRCDTISWVMETLPALHEDLAPQITTLARRYRRANGPVITLIGSHNLLSTPSRKLLDDAEMRPLIDEFLHGADQTDAETRAALFRTAWDFVGSSLGGRNALYERFYLTSAARNRMLAHVANLDRSRPYALVDSILAAGHNAS